MGAAPMGLRCRLTGCGEQRFPRRAADAGPPPAAGFLGLSDSQPGEGQRGLVVRSVAAARLSPAFVS